MSKSNYSQAYQEMFQSPWWSWIRGWVIRRDKGVCQRCGCKPKSLDVHHYYYPLDPYKIPMSGLVALCRSCHKVADRERITQPSKRYKLQPIQKTQPKRLTVLQQQQESNQL